MTREEAIQRLEFLKGVYSVDTETAIDMAIEALQADAVSLTGTMKYLTKPHNYCEVVRCKDCRWYESRYGEVCHNPRYGDGHANYSPPYVDEEYWCKDGERREP